MKKISKKLICTIVIVMLGCIVMAITDAIFKPTYIIKSIIKIIFFLIIPLIYFWKNKDSEIKKIIIPSKKGLIKSLILGVGVYVIIFSAYLIIRNFYDFFLIADLLINNVGVNGNNFIFIALYISFCNSLLEEFFFRGFAFLNIIKYMGRKWAYLFSSVMFAVYHIAIMNGWFSPILFVLAMLGLMIGGFIFNYLDEKNENIYNSWMVHMFANFAINTIGFIIFGIFN